MVRLLISLAVTVGLVWGILWLRGSAESPPGAEATLVLGFTILTAHALGMLLKPLGLPLVTGYLILGIAAGPHALHLVSRETVGELRLIDSIALALIALTAGGELVLDRIRPLLRSIVSVTLGQLILITGLMSLFFALVVGWVPFADGMTSMEILALCLLVGVLSAASSPATTIAVITELRAKGRMTSTVLGVTVLKDILVILLFTVVLSLGGMLFQSHADLAVGDVLGISLRLITSAGVGFLLAALLVPILPRVGRQAPALMAAVAILVACTAAPLNLDPLILCIAAGFAVRNFSSRGRELILGIEGISPLIYTVFFTVAGADLNLIALRDMWPIATVLVLARAASTLGATWVGSRVVEDEPTFRRWGGMGFIAQAGVDVGLVSVVAQQFPTWGVEFKTLIVAALAINQITGPVVFRLALLRAGEATVIPTTPPPRRPITLRPREATSGATP